MTEICDFNRLNLTRRAMALKYYQEAIAYHKDALQHNPADILIYEGIAKACLEKGFAAQALEYLHQAALLCLKAKQSEKMRQILAEMQAINGSDALAESLEAELKMLEKKA